MVSFENLEFKKDDTSAYAGAFDFFINFLQEINIPEKDLKGKNQVIEKLDILVRVINNLINFEEENHKLDEKFLYILSIINKSFNKFIEYDISITELLREVNTTLDNELADIFNNYLNSDFNLFTFKQLSKTSLEEKLANLKLKEELTSIKKYYSDNLVKLNKIENSNKNQSSADIYSKIENDFKKLEEKYRFYFFTFVILTFMFTVGYNPLIGIWDNIVGLSCSLSINTSTNCLTLNNQTLYPFNGNTLKYIIFKFAILLVGITLSTYFLKLTSFYQLRQEQAKQTKLELEAFPDYVSGMDQDIANNIRKELALKYFGKDVDKTQIDKSGDLLQDQMKINTDILKATIDLFKSTTSVNIKDEDSKIKNHSSQQLRN